MSDFVVNWTVNVLIQFTCLAACGLAIATLLRRSPAARSGVLFSALILALLILPVTAVMLWSEHSILAFTIEPVNDSEDESTGNLSDSEQIHAATKSPSNWHESHAIPIDGDVDPLANVSEPHGLPLDSHSSAMHRVDFHTANPSALGDRPIGDLSVEAFATPTDVIRDASGTKQSTIARTIIRIAAGAGWVWLAGAIMLWLRLAVNWYRLGQFLRESKPCHNLKLEKILTRIAGELRIPHIPEVVVSDGVSGPISAGIFRPRIVLPAQLCDRISDDQLHDILIHEVAHIIRRDQMKVLLQNFASACYWPHPLAHAMNRALAQAREEVCDNYVLNTSNPPSYSHTLLTLAELIPARAAVPGTVGLFTSSWKLENRVAGLLDERRSRLLRLGTLSKLLVATMTFVLAIFTAFGTFRVAIAQQSQSLVADVQIETAATVESPKHDNAVKSDLTRQNAAPTLRGRGKDAEMLLRGVVLDADGSPASDVEISANVKTKYGRAARNVESNGNEFRVWIPVGGNDWFYVELTAQSKDGLRVATIGLAMNDLRQNAIDGIRLQLANADRIVTVTIKKDGRPIENAHVVAATLAKSPQRSTTDISGKATFSMLQGEEIDQLTAWTDDYLIGGYSFSRKPRPDPLGSDFEIELETCRDQTVRLLHAKNDSPIANVAFNLVLGTGPPNYNFAAVPNSFPHSRMTTDTHGEAVCRWFPDWEQHGAYVDIVDPNWAKALEKLETTDDGALVMKLRPRGPREPFIGKVISDGHNVSGLMLQIHSFQAEEEGYSDHVSAFTNLNGEFSADCIPGSTYCVCVSDVRLVSNIIDLIPYEPDSGKSNRAELTVSEGQPIEIRVTTGPSRRPMAHTWMNIKENHDYSWYEDGEQKFGFGGRSWGVYTDANGVAKARANAGSTLEIGVYAGNWRSDDRKVTVGENELTVVEFHREVDVERNVSGQLVAPPGSYQDLAGAEIYYGSIDGETDEEEKCLADANGQFTFTTRAIQLGIFAYTADGKAAGILKPESLDGSLELKLSPTADFNGQLLGKRDQPLVNHGVRVRPAVRGKQDFGHLFSTALTTKTFETTTDNQGNYTLKQLPTGIDLSMRADPIDGADHDAYLNDFSLTPGEARPRTISRLGAAAPDNRSLSEKYDATLRDAKLNDFHLLVMIFDSTSDDFVGRNLMDHKLTNEAMSFMDLRIRETDAADPATHQFIEVQAWPQPQRGDVFVCALDGTGKELGRATLDVRADDVQSQAAEFLRKYAPAPADAEAKWDAAFAEAKRSGRKVWARIGQRYCGPCFRLSRWLDENREQLERDYVLLKIDNVRDKHGLEMANRIVSDREHFGIPFHAIFDAQETLLIDSEGPTGNIGFPSGIEGQRHLRKMLSETKTNLTASEIDEIVSTVK